MSKVIYNVYDAYLYKFKKFILVLTYTPGFNIQFIIDSIVDTFKLHPVKLEGSEMLNGDSTFNYDKLNKDVNELLEDNNRILNQNPKNYYGTGLLLYGLSFPADKLHFNIDLHLHFSNTISLFLKSTADPTGKYRYTADDYNKFKQLLSNNKIHKYFNLKSDPTEEINDSVHDKIIDFIEFKIYGKNYETYATKFIKENASKNVGLVSDPDVIPVTEISEENEKLNNAVDKLQTDLSLSIESDLINDDDPTTKKKHTNRYKYEHVTN